MKKRVCNVVVVVVVKMVGGIYGDTGGSGWSITWVLTIQWLRVEKSQGHKNTSGVGGVDMILKDVEEDNGGRSERVESRWVFFIPYRSSSSHLSSEEHQAYVSATPPHPTSAAVALVPQSPVP